MIRILILAIFIFISLEPLLAQDSTSTKVRDQLEEVFEDIDLSEVEGGEQLIQFLQELENNPVNINSADVTELIQVPGISFVTARSIIAYRDLQPFEKTEDILLVSGIGQAIYQKISPYITIGSRSNQIAAIYLDPNYWLRNSRVEFISRYQQTLEEQIGFKTPDSLGGFVGNSAKYYQRIKIRSNHLSFNLTQEKDAGESLTGPTDFDFNSMHIGFLNNGRLKKLIIGDYSLSFGQGLVLWSGGSFGKGREVIKSIGRNERGVRPYTSAQESNFFRGVAATVGDKNEFTFFYSNNPQTASVVGVDSVRFPSSSGFHRTINEIGRRNNVNQTTIGGRFRLDTKVGLFGISGYSSSFNSSIVSGNSISNQNDFNGRINSVVGLDYRALIRRSLIIGEFARSDTDGYAGVMGIESNVGDDTEISILLRSYSPNYISILGNGFGELSGNPQNEKGFYIGLRHHLQSFTVSTYFDQYYFDDPNAGILVPSGGIDILAMIEANISSSLTGYLLIRTEAKDDVFDSETQSGREIQQLGTQTRTSYRIQVQHQPTKTFRSRSRVEWIKFNSEENDIESGFLLYQDVRVVLSKKLLLDTRFTLFDTESFNARLYQFENDLRYILTNVALNDKGQRWYMVLKYDVTESLELSTKLSRTVIEDALVLSSGLNQINGNTRTFLGVQVRWNF